MSRRLGGVPLGARSHSEIILGCFLEDFRLHLGPWRGTLGVNLEPESPTWSVYVDFSMLFAAATAAAAAGAAAAAAAGAAAAAAAGAAAAAAAVAVAAAATA